MTNFTKFAAATSLAMLLPVMGSAMTEMDTDGDGMLSMSEVQAAHPDMTEEQFNEADTNGDGMLDEMEVQAARDAGMMPES